MTTKSDVFIAPMILIISITFMIVTSTSAQIQRTHNNIALANSVEAFYDLPYIVKPDTLIILRLRIWQASAKTGIFVKPKNVNDFRWVLIDTSKDIFKEIRLEETVEITFDNGGNKTKVVRQHRRAGPNYNSFKFNSGTGRFDREVGRDVTNISQIYKQGKRPERKNKEVKKNREEKERNDKARAARNK